MSDCVEQLQLLEEMGRVWSQSMMLVLQAPRLTLTDIETKVSAAGWWGRSSGLIP